MVMRAWFCGVLTFVLSLLVLSCGDDNNGKTCEHGGQTYDVGETFPAGDGCNTCTCAAGGSVQCTKLACTDGGNGE